MFELKFKKLLKKILRTVRNWPFPLSTCCYDLNTITIMLWKYQKSFGD